MLATSLPEQSSLEQLVQVTKAAGDNLRAGILQVLNAESFGVLELGRIFDMAQPAMSHHLRILAEAGLVTKRKEGTSVFYQRVSPAGQPLIGALFSEIDACSIPKPIARRVIAVYKAREKHTLTYFANHTRALSNQRELICSPEIYTPTVIEAALHKFDTPRPLALEVGPGGGDLLAALSARFKQVLAIDNSREMLAEAATKATELTNVELREQDLSAMDNQRRFDLVLATMVLHHQPSPGQFFSKVGSLLKDDGLFVIADLCPHAHDWVKDRCGDLWLGFTTEQLSDWAKLAGLNLTDHQFLAQRNGFTVQVITFKPLNQEPTSQQLR